MTLPEYRKVQSGANESISRKKDKSHGGKVQEGVKVTVHPLYDARCSYYKSWTRARMCNLFSSERHILRA